MDTATISEAKNRLSAVLDKVKAGRSVLITDRGVPIARIEPVVASDDPAGRRERLVRAGIVRPAGGSLPADFMAGPTDRLPGPSLVDAVLEERRSGW